MAPEAKKDLDTAERELCALMQRYLAGELEAFDGIYGALAGRVRGYLLSQCRDAARADDLLQETFLQLHRSRRTYEPGRPVTPWVFAIARHVYLMHRRSTGRRLRFEDALAADRSGDRARDDERTIVHADQIEHALRDVPADQRDALLLHHVEGWSFVEIAGRLGIRVNAAKTRAFRGVRKMREQLRKPPTTR
ncbi:MAG TPA: RNA polymerase sigma factor [Vicinamibacterales bacterium]|jgi:RNA polymerase sigma-70 factor (ECF subfamily)